MLNHWEMMHIKWQSFNFIVLKFPNKNIILIVLVRYINIKILNNNKYRIYIFIYK